MHVNIGISHNQIGSWTKAQVSFAKDDIKFSRLPTRYPQIVSKRQLTPPRDAFGIESAICD